MNTRAVGCFHLREREKWVPIPIQDAVYPKRQKTIAKSGSDPVFGFRSAKAYADKVLQPTPIPPAASRAPWSIARWASSSPASNAPPMQWAFKPKASSSSASVRRGSWPAQITTWSTSSTMSFVPSTVMCRPASSMRRKVNLHCRRTLLKTQRHPLFSPSCFRLQP